MLYKPLFAPSSQEQPDHVECTTSGPLREVKRRLPGPVLWWGTPREVPLCSFLHKSSSITFFVPEANQLVLYLCTVEFRVNEDHPTTDRHRRIKCHQRVKQKQRYKLPFVAEMSFSISFQRCMTCARWNIETSSRFKLIGSEPAHTISKRNGGGRVLGSISRFLPHHVRNSQITLRAQHTEHSV